MSKISQKALIALNKEVRVTVYSFKADGQRDMTYSNMTITTAFMHVALKTSMGLRVLIVSDELIKEKGLPSVDQLEFRKESGRVTYEEVLPYAEMTRSEYLRKYI